MTDEEKKAIDILINEIADIVISEYCTHCKICENEDTECYYTKIIDIVYNLVQKQSKEIEELKTINQMQKYRIEVIDERELISKDIIKEILGIEENIDNEKLLSLLQTIVDENARLEDIEDRKVQIEYNNVFNKGVKSVEDKIKAKIEELQDDIKYSANPLSIDNSKFGIKVLQSLLEKE